MEKIKEKDKKQKSKKPINFSLNFSEQILKIPFFQNINFERKIDRDLEQRIILKININEEEYYIGETIENLPDGFGILKTKQFIYKGSFKLGEKNGPGILQLNNNKESYNLFFEDDKLLKNYCMKIEQKYIIEGGIEEYKKKNKFQFKDIAIVTNKHKKEKMECEIKNKEMFFVKKYNIEKPNIYIYGSCNKFGEPFNDTIMEVDKNSYLIILNYINGKQEGYFEKYNINGKYTFGNIHQGKLSGYEFNVDHKNFSFGKFVNGIKEGPFQVFSNYKKNKDSMVLTQIYLYGFLSKNVDKYENGSKYILQNYPEYANFLKINYKSILNILEKYIGENKYEQYLNKFEDKKKEKKEKKSNKSKDKKTHKDKSKEKYCSNNNNNNNSNQKSPLKENK